MRKPVIGMVVIGRNEGQQLRQCLESAKPHVQKVVYVDSGSTDGSVEMAESLGVTVVRLDMAIPFTAARARNEGFDRLSQLLPDMEMVHFLDGDVEMVDTWMDSAIQVMLDHPKAAVLSGLRMERYPEKAAYIRLCDIEWNKPDGYPACEGDAIMRVEAFRKVGGFNKALIAGEEPELCLRYWQAGYECLRNREPMTWHDVGLLHFSQWWKREMRTGYSYAEGAAMYGRLHYLRQSMGIWFWGAAVPLGGIVLAWPTYGVSFILWQLAYCLLFYRAYRGARPRAKNAKRALEYAFFNILSKFPMLTGMTQYWLRRITGKRPQLIEYRKTSAPASVP